MSDETLKDMYRGVLSRGINDTKYIRHKGIGLLAKKLKVRPHVVMDALRTGKPLNGRIYSVRL